VKGATIVIAVLVLLGLAGGEFVSVRNDLVLQREAVDAQWANIEAVLQRRADLIPNLVETVKGFAKHETEVFQSIADARAALAGAHAPQEKIQANGQLDGALSRLLVITENYPQLRSNENFLRLQDELSGSENRIAVERRKYNEALQHYNASIDLFPSNWVASLAGFHRNDAYFKTEPGAAVAPKVKF
jgi:LemA protein